MFMKDQLKASTSFVTRTLDEYYEAAQACAARRDGKTPSDLWEDLQDLEPLDIIVQFEDGTFGRPALDRRSGRIVRYLVEVRR